MLSMCWMQCLLACRVQMLLCQQQQQQQLELELPGKPTGQC
jgi:hypothetical protein